MSELSLEKFGDEMLSYLPRLCKEISHHDSHYIKSGQITVQQVWALDYFAHQKDCQMKDLSDCMCINFSSATGLVDRLAKQGLVKRKRKETDRRAVYIEITPKGQRILKDVYQQKRKGLIKLFSRLSAKDRFAYIQLIKKLLKDFSSVKA